MFSCRWTGPTSRTRITLRCNIHSFDGNNRTKILIFDQFLSSLVLMILQWSNFDLGSYFSLFLILYCTSISCSWSLILARWWPGSRQGVRRLESWWRTRIVLIGTESKARTSPPPSPMCFTSPQRGLPLLYLPHPPPPPHLKRSLPL